VAEGTLTWNAPFDNHPARVASRKAMELTTRRAKEEWLDLYTPDAVIQDPVGPSPFDPEGVGHKGRDRIAAHWDGTIATTERIDVEINASYVAGNEVANVGTLTVHLAGDVQLKVTGVFVYKVRSDGLIESLRGYFEFDRAMGSFRSEGE
jgi:steroid Delta-isomerase